MKLEKRGQFIEFGELYDIRDTHEEHKQKIYSLGIQQSRLMMASGTISVYHGNAVRDHGSFSKMVRLNSKVRISREAIR